MVGILKIFEKSLGIGLLLTFIFSFTGFANNCDNLSSKVLRLHILANSDSKADQELKIKVRDKIIEKSGDFLNGATDKVSAQNLTAENLENIKKIALEEVKEQGYYYPISVEITDMYFPTRKYGNTTFRCVESIDWRGQRPKLVVRNFSTDVFRKCKKNCHY